MINMLKIDTSSKNREAIEFCKSFLDNSSTNPKFIFGINIYAESIAKRINIDGFIDEFRTEQEYMGKPVYHKLEDVPDNALVVITVVGIHPKSAKKKVEERGLRNLDYFAFYRYSGLEIESILLFDFRKFGIDFRKHRKGYERVFSMLADQESKDVFTRLINFRLSYDIKYLEPFSDRRHLQYFEDFVEPQKPIGFVDVGGFEGETTVEFIKRFPVYKTIYFFEPDKMNLEKAMQVLSIYKNIHIYNLALYNKKTILRLQPRYSASTISEEGTVCIHTEKMDNIIDEPVSYIKIDVEGTEKEVIEGAQKTILKSHPIISVAVYHKAEDLRQIPEQILSIRKDYRLYLRHYTEGFTETIMYFIPEKE